jgi:WXG100 family type VII secretion target
MTTPDGYIHVNYGQVTDVYDAFMDATQQVNAAIEMLQQAVQPLAASWVGVSRDEYSQVQARWQSDLADMNSALVNSAHTLDEMSYNYSTTDKNLAFQWQQITG